MDGDGTLAGGTRLGAAVLTAALLLAPASGAAKAESTPPPQPPANVAAVDVYRESIPTSAGPRVVDSGVLRTTPLPPAIQRRLRNQGGRDAALLEDVATSLDLGAPITRQVFGATRPRSDLPRGWAPRGFGSVAQTQILVLLAFLVAATAGGVVLKLRRA